MGDEGEYKWLVDRWIAAERVGVSFSLLSLDIQRLLRVTTTMNDPLCPSPGKKSQERSSG